jgi:hypothetical protein
VLEARAAYTDQKLRDILLAEDRNDEMPTESRGKHANNGPWPGCQACKDRPSSIAASVREHKYEETVASAMRAAKLASAAAATATRRTSKNMQKYTDENLRDILLAEDRNDETPTVSQRQLTNKDQLTNKHPSWALAHDTSSAKNSENTESTDQGLLCMQQKSLGLTNMLDAMTSFTSTLSFEACSSPQSSIVIPPNTDTRKLERDHKSIMKKRT